MKYTDCDLFQHVLNVPYTDEYVGICEDEGGNNAVCQVWVNPEYVCEHLKGLEEELEERLMEERIIRGE